MLLTYFWQNLLNKTKEGDPVTHQFKHTEATNFGVWLIRKLQNAMIWYLALFFNGNKKPTDLYMTKYVTLIFNTS